jgi:flagellar basal body-associated protein FliL
MAEEETPAPEENAEATETAEAGAEAAAEAPAEVAPPQSLWMPMMMSSVVSIVGVVVLFMFVIKPGINSAIETALQDANSTKSAKADEGEADGHGDGHGGGGDDGHGGDKADDKATVDDSAGEIPIVEDGDNIVVNPSGSNGTRYLMVEIFLTRGKKSDTGFRKAIMSHTKKLKKITMDKLASLDTQQCTDPSIRPRIVYQLKSAYQEVLGSGHPIEELILATWVMQ